MRSERAADHSPPSSAAALDHIETISYTAVVLTSTVVILTCFVTGECVCVLVFWHYVYLCLLCFVLFVLWFGIVSFTYIYSYLFCLY